MKLRYKIIISVVLLGILIITGSAFLGAEYLAELCLSPVKPEDARDSEYYLPQKSDVQNKEEDPFELAAQSSMDESYIWLKENAAVKSIQSFDNLTLRAYVVKNESHNWLIAMHGFRSEPRSMSPYARHFFEEGFNVVVPGQRGHGWSDGTFIDMGYYCADDVKSWVDEIIRNDSESRIVLYGLSMGASAVLMAQNKNLPENVVCIIEDSAYTSAWDELAFKMQKNYGLPANPLLSITSLIAKKRYGFRYEDVSPLEAVKKARKPVLFIHGVDDDVVPLSMLSELYDASSCVKEKFEVPGAQNSRSLFADTFAYWEKVDSFVFRFFKEIN